MIFEKSRSKNGGVCVGRLARTQKILPTNTHEIINFYQNLRFVHACFPTQKCMLYMSPMVMFSWPFQRGGYGNPREHPGLSTSADFGFFHVFLWRSNYFIYWKNKIYFKSRVFNENRIIHTLKMHYHRRHIEHTFFDDFLALLNAS